MNGMNSMNGMNGMNNITQDMIEYATEDATEDQDNNNAPLSAKGKSEKDPLEVNYPMYPRPNYDAPYHSLNPRKKMHWFRKQPATKYKYNAPDGKRLTAGGIFLYDEVSGNKGMWLVEEEEMAVRVYTDFGGKYDHNDGDINATISREFREETYNTAEIPYAAIKAVPETQRVFIDGFDHKPVYVCVVANINDFGIRFDEEKIIKERVMIINANPQIPERWYKTLNVKFVLLRDISSGNAKISSRLYAILLALCENLKKYDPKIQHFFKDFVIRR